MIPTEVQEALVKISFRLKDAGVDPVGREAFETVKCYLVECSIKLDAQEPE